MTLKIGTELIMMMMIVMTDNAHAGKYMNYTERVNIQADRQRDRLPSLTTDLA